MIDPDDILEVMPLSPREEMLARAKMHVGFLMGLAIILAAAACAMFSPLIATHDPYLQDLSGRLIPPVWEDAGSWSHLFGTDSLGRDLFSRVVYGSQVSMIVGFGAVMMSGAIGSIIGMCGGYFGGWVDALVIFLVSVKLAMPGVLIALSLVTVFGGSLTTITLIIGLLFWDRFAVVTRAATQQIRVNDYIVAAETVGASKLWIICREILPNLMNAIIVVASLEMAVAILVEAALSFLGIGLQPPTPSWGLLLSDGRAFMFLKPYLIMIPGFAIFILVVGINLFGDGLRDITSPQGRK